MPKSKVERKTLAVSSLLIKGSSIKNAAKLSGLNYSKVHYMRNKLVKAGALQPLHRVTKKRVSTLLTETQSSSSSIRLLINGTELNVRNAKSIHVTTGLVDIKY